MPLLLLTKTLKKAFLCITKPINMVQTIYINAYNYILKPIYTQSLNRYLEVYLFIYLFRREAWRKWTDVFKEWADQEH